MDDLGGPRSAASGVFEVSPAGPELRLLRNSSIAGRADPWTLDARAHTDKYLVLYSYIYIYICVFNYPFNIGL